MLWLCALAGPLTWAVCFGADFTLSGWTCYWQSKLAMVVLTVVAVGITAAAGAGAFAGWSAVGREWPSGAAGPAARSRMLAIAGIGLNAMFGLVLLAQMIPQFLLGACE